MKLDVLRTTMEFNQLTEEWDHLLRGSASDVPFLRHEYPAIWWRTLGSGEWSHGESFIVTGRQEDGGLIGIAPLFFTDNRRGESALVLLGISKCRISWM